jgi:phosphoserine phosphatase
MPFLPVLAASQSMTYTAPLAHALAVAIAPPASFHRSVATDADGTIWSVDVGDALFLRVATREDFRGVGAEKLRAHGARLLGPTAIADLSLGAIARALFDGYERGDIDVRTMCDLEAETVADRPATDFEALVDEVAAQAAAAVRTEVGEFLREAHARGVRVHVVSGSLGVLVERSLTRAQIPFDRVTGAVLARDGAWIRAEIARTSPLFEGKVRALEEDGAWPAAVGLGDGGWDHTFLRHCAVPVLIHPKPALVEAMRDVPGVLRVG